MPPPHLASDSLTGMSQTETELPSILRWFWIAIVVFTAFAYFATFFFVPGNYVFYNEIRMGGQLKAVILLVLFFISLRYPFESQKPEPTQTLAEALRHPFQQPRPESLPLNSPAQASVSHI